MLSSVASEGFALMPEPAIMPLLPKHVHALTSARGPIVLNAALLRNLPEFEWKRCA
jgi:hypothetical protein